MKQLDVQILQQGYRLACAEGQEARLLDAVQRVDAAMTRIHDAGKIRARERIAVLAALNLAFEIADRDAAAAMAAQAAEAAASAPATQPAQPAQQDDAAAHERLQQLIARLDQALGEPTPGL